MIRAALFALLLSTLAPAPPAPNIAGTWKVTMDADSRRNPDKPPKQIEGTFVFAQKGGEITGSWSSLDEWTLTGHVDERGRLELTTERRVVPFNSGGKSGTVQGRWTFTGTLADGALSGTAALEVEDAKPVPRQWSAKRK